MNKAKNSENVLSFEVVELFLVQYNLADNRYQKSYVIC